MISVVIPLYNKDEYIVDTVASVLDQKFQDFELIIIDDGSTDDSVSEVEKHFSDPRIKLVRRQNKGVSIARNEGIQISKNQWIAFLDADDWWADNFLAEISEAIRLFPEKRLFASGRSRVFKSGEERYKNRFIPAEGKTDLVDHFQVITKAHPPINSSNVVIHKSLFEEKGYFRSGMSRHEDHDLWLRLCSEEEIVFVNKNLSFYRKATDSSASQGLYRADDFMQYLGTLIELKQILNLTKRAYLNKYYRRFVPLAYLQYQTRYTKQERRELTTKMKELLGPGFVRLVQLAGHLRLFQAAKWIKGTSKR